MIYSIKQRKSKVAGFRLLSIRFRFQEGVWDYSLNIKVKEGYFNPRDKSIKEDLSGSIRLHNILDIVDRIKLSMQSEGYGYIALEEYKKRFLQDLIDKKLIYDKKSDAEEINILYIHDYIEEYVITKENSSLMKPSTSTTYRRLTKHLKSFDHSWEVNKTDHIKIQQFRLYLIENKLAAATINLMLVRLKTALKHYNQHDGELSEKLFSSSYFQKMKEIKRKRVYITLEELSTIYNMEIEDAKLKKARDLFLIGCYTALRVSDWEIKPSDISDDKSTLTFKTKKTGQIVSIPLFLELKEILRRNDWKTPMLKTNQITGLIKELCRKAGIIRPFKSYLVFPDRTEEVIGEAWEFVTSHTCRRSFATNAYLEGMPVSQIRVFTGHANDKVFMNYVQATDSEISKQVKLDALTNIFNNEKHRSN